MDGKPRMGSGTIFKWKPINPIVDHNQVIYWIETTMGNIGYYYYQDGVNDENVDDTNCGNDELPDFVNDNFFID